MLNILIASFGIMIASLIGVLFTWKTARGFIQKNLGLLVSFSAGVFLVVVYSLGKEVFEEGANATSSIIWILVGAIGITLLFRMLPGFHHHHDESHEHTPHSKIDIRRIISSDAVHNIGDGILLAASFSVNTSVGFFAMASIFVHELVQEISEFFVLKQAGLSTKRALGINFLASSTILIGSVVGFLLIDIFKFIEIPILAISAGAFLMVVSQDLIPESIRHSKHTRGYWKYVLVFLLGVAIMFSVTSISAH